MVSALASKIIYYDNLEEVVVRELGNRYIRVIR